MPYIGKSQHSLYRTFRIAFSLNNPRHQLPDPANQSPLHTPQLLHGSHLAPTAFNRSRSSFMVKGICARTMSVSRIRGNPFTITSGEIFPTTVSSISEAYFEIKLNLRYTDRSLWAATEDIVNQFLEMDNKKPPQLSHGGVSSGTGQQVGRLHKSRPAFR